MYNMIFGRNPNGPAILRTLDLTPEDCGRFRDCFVANGEIAVYTRNGGGNREYQEEAIELLQEHPNYLRDEDDDFDYTYATFYFSLPNEWREELGDLDSGVFDPSRRWLDMLAKLKEATDDTES